METVQTPHFYQNLEGWFDFDDMYQLMVDSAAAGAHFVEVGAWLGKSTSYMAVAALNSGKNIRFDVVDTWRGSENETTSTHALAVQTDVFEIFKVNLAPVLNSINPVRLASVEAAATYADGSLDFVFIDANHTYEAVMDDIRAWLPKVRPGGYIGGHDYNPGWPGVIQAADECFGRENLTIMKSSWLSQKPA